MSNDAVARQGSWQAFDQVLCLLNSLDVPADMTADQMRRKIYGLVHGLRPGGSQSLSEHLLENRCILGDECGNVFDQGKQSLSEGRDSPELLLQIEVALEREFPECVDEGRAGFIQRLAKAALSALPAQTPKSGDNQ